ncbi:NAD(P)/FAD-dependent oxidoreductase [Hippea alviniae]|uniref:NAD(P)/FAD-dependent oxidoreductase n=1 Tax=Hippea alviniae TaxID=1279027 RepID=UPI0003B428B7|nr:FAD/NAD(P)-binding oxidoreductase [Hippea alviniae]
MIAIVGGSIAAFVAYRTIKKYQPDADVKVFSKESVIPYSKMLLPYILTSNVEANMFYPIGDDLFLEKEIVELDADEKYIKDKSNWKYYYDKLIIATGADAKKPSFEGDYDADKIITIRYLNDIYKIRDLIRQASFRRVVIVGAGLVSMEMGHALSMAGFDVRFVVGSNRILSQILNKSSADFVEKIITDNHRVEFYKQDGIETINSYNDGLIVKLKSSKEIECDFVVVGRGVSPNVSFLSGDFSDGVEVDEFLKTGFRDVYAVGDVAKSYDAVVNKKISHAIWPVAIEEAEIAARNVLGFDMTEEPQITRNVLPVFGMNIFTAGVSKLEEYDGILEDYSDGLRRILFKDGMLDGFVFVGDVYDFGEYVNIMRKRVNIKGVEKALLFSSKAAKL